MSAAAVVGASRRLWLVASDGHRMSPEEQEPEAQITDAEGADELIDFVANLHDRLPADSTLREVLAGFAARLERHRADE